MQQKQTFKKGFTLIELVITITIVAIISGVIYPIIRMGVESYKNQILRKEIVTRGRLAIEKISRDIRASVPNTILIQSTLNANDTVEFGSSSFFSSYSKIDNFSSPYVLNDNSGLTLPGAAFLVIYNTNPNQYYNYLTDPTPSTFPITAIGGNTIIFNTLNKPFSPYNRYCLSNGPVTYSLNGTGQLIRYSNYLPGGSFGAAAIDQNILIDNVESLSFSYVSGTLTNESVLSIVFKITMEGFSMDFHQEVHIRNVP